MEIDYEKNRIKLVVSTAFLLHIYTTTIYI